MYFPTVQTVFPEALISTLTLAPGQAKSSRRLVNPDIRCLRRCPGFTLLELLVVMVISGILLGVVTLNSTVGEREWLRQEARRIALLLQMARDEAIVRDRSISLVLDEYRYRFLIRQNTQWELMADDPIWREREFTHAPVEITLTPSTNAQSPITILFGREPVNSPFVLTLAQKGQSASVSADGLGNFQVK